MENYIKVGMFPGKLEEVAVADGTTVKEALDMVGITVGDEQEVKLDGESVSLSDTIDGGSRLLVSKRLKGAR